MIRVAVGAFDRPKAFGYATKVTPGTSAIELNLRWLVRLRWALFLGLLVAVPLAERALHVALPSRAFALIVAVGAASNLVAWWLIRTRTTSRRSIAALLLIDVVLTTLALFFAGGVYNPFVLSFLALLVLCAALLGRRAAARLAFVIAACVALLAVRHEPLKADHEHGQDDGHHGHDAAVAGHAGDHHEGVVDPGAHVRVHAEDMWLAFVVLALFIGYLGNWSLRQRELELAALRAEKARSDRLAELGALAATAAHEIASPLTTIAVVSTELVRAVERGEHVSARVEDLRLIREEVERCRDALDAMARRARGDDVGPVRIPAVVEEARTRVPQPHRVNVELGPGARRARVDAPAAALIEVLRGLLANALEASPSDETVDLLVSDEGDRCRIDVLDTGAGMTADELGRVGREPFTTKGTMGMGLFAGRAVIERLGGEVELASRSGLGTRVTLRLPLSKS